ncbi:dynein light chain like protein [Spraguea lophii 42_110]|uniref:Dynein light chain like protein n=1 Tax=Spraguea lophii (strain 42_110) TaxID=1358809 RepID=S7XPX1_SPRLO|nr:dynein light chain like protein [Spraguea lophii 42_110]
MSEKSSTKEEKTVDPMEELIKILNCEMSETMEETIKKIILKNIKEKKGVIEEIDIKKLTNDIYKKMEKTYGTGWNVFVGGYFSGCCTYEENHYAEFQVGKNRAVIFKMPAVK